MFCGQSMLACLLRPSRIDGAKHAAAVLRLLVSGLVFGRLGRRVIEANFAGGALSSDGALMLAAPSVEDHHRF